MNIANLGYREVLDRFDGYLDYLEEIKKIKDKIEWEKAKRKNTQIAYEKYLIKYPNGIYSFKAQEKIDQFIAIKRKRKEDQNAWEKAQEINTKRSYEEYLQIYPNGIFVKYANARIEDLKKNENIYSIIVGISALIYISSSFYSLGLIGGLGLIFLNFVLFIILGKILAEYIIILLLFIANIFIAMNWTFFIGSVLSVSVIVLGSILYPELNDF